MEGVTHQYKERGETIIGCMDKKTFCESLAHRYSCGYDAIRKKTTNVSNGPFAVIALNSEGSLLIIRDGEPSLLESEVL